MILRTLGFGATIAAVVVLLGSAVVGLRAPSSADLPELQHAVPETPSRRIRVEVLNGAGIAGLARDVTERLRASGFDVVHYGNAGSLARDSTTLLDRSGDAAAIAALQNALNLHRVESAIDTSLYLEATLVLAPDWAARDSSASPN